MNRYVTTGTAARALGVDRATLTRWATTGSVTPAERTAGGHYRWDLDALRAQLRQLDPERAASGLAETAARVIHAANRELQLIQGDPQPSPPWDEAPQYQREESVASAEAALADPGLTPEQNHQGWMDRLTADGWRRGDRKDPDARTHPLLVPWEELPAGQKLKDRLFLAIVRAMAED